MKGKYTVQVDHHSFILVGFIVQIIYVTIRTRFVSVQNTYEWHTIKFFVKTSMIFVVFFFRPFFSSFEMLVKEFTVIMISHLLIPVHLINLSQFIDYTYVIILATG